MELGPTMTELLSQWDGATGSQGPTLRGAARQVRDALARDEAGAQARNVADLTDVLADDEPGERAGEGVEEQAPPTKQDDEPGGSVDSPTLPTEPEG